MNRAGEKRSTERNTEMIVNKFVMAYGVEHDRLRAILPDGFVSLRPVLRIDAEASPTGAVYVEFNTPVEKDGRKGWLNIGSWSAVSFERRGKTAEFSCDDFEISFTCTGIEGGCPAEKDNEGCYYTGETEIFRAAEPVSANKEFCDCSFRWKNSACGAHGRSSGRTIPAYPSDVRTIYPKSGFNVENAARIPCEQVLGSYTVRIER